MSKKPISPLRQRMIDDMTARRFKEKVQKDYVRHVKTFAAFLGRSPDTATSEDLRRYQLHMAQQQVSPWSINSAIAALRFFFIVTLENGYLQALLGCGADVIHLVACLLGPSAASASPSCLGASAGGDVRGWLSSATNLSCMSSSWSIS